MQIFSTYRFKYSFFIQDLNIVQLYQENLEYLQNKKINFIKIQEATQEGQSHYQVLNSRPQKWRAYVSQIIFWYIHPNTSRHLKIHSVSLRYWEQSIWVFIQHFGYARLNLKITWIDFLNLDSVKFSKRMISVGPLMFFIYCSKLYQIPKYVSIQSKRCNKTLVLVIFIFLFISLSTDKDFRYYFQF